jgi:hypothetical protein
VPFLHTAHVLLLGFIDRTQACMLEQNAAATCKSLSVRRYYFKLMSIQILQIKPPVKTCDCYVTSRQCKGFPLWAYRLARPREGVPLHFCAGNDKLNYASKQAVPRAFSALRQLGQKERLDVWFFDGEQVSQIRKIFLVRSNHHHCLYGPWNIDYCSGALSDQERPPRLIFSRGVINHACACLSLLIFYWLPHCCPFPGLGPFTQFSLACRNYNLSYQPRSMNARLRSKTCKRSNQGVW